jgi:hypothetical protein
LPYELTYQRKKLDIVAAILKRIAELKAQYIAFQAQHSAYVKDRKAKTAVAAEEPLGTALATALALANGMSTVAATATPAAATRITSFSSVLRATSASTQPASSPNALPTTVAQAHGGKKKKKGNKSKA